MRDTVEIRSPAAGRQRGPRSRIAPEDVRLDDETQAHSRRRAAHADGSTPSPGSHGTPRRTTPEACANLDHSLLGARAATGTSDVAPEAAALPANAPPPDKEPTHNMTMRSG
ncbi:hypothetical protein [Streptomyces sp. NBC_01727]|uniref:hypothetical protein n=1 Tax=Streptomyces sp. NBC_01727 TaxID=2975924 RepID=UPI002E166D22|nr:hypothetical protein OIE76_38820 [Streptomyces sp. NBC_01727]